MAVIAPIAGAPHGSLISVRTGTAQANTGQTDWVTVPDWAKFATVDFNLTAVAGTSPLVTVVRLLGVDPVTRDDAYQYNIAEHVDLATIDYTGAAHLVVDIGPGITGIADEVTQAATGFSRAAINAILPSILGILLTFDRTTGDETYTYTLSVRFKA